MFAPTIKSYTPGMTLPVHHFFALNKGMNSGRPSKQPNANCFIVSASTAEESENLYWLSYALWAGHLFYPVLRGSVIPFISLEDYKRHLRKYSSYSGNINNLLATLKAIQEEEKKAKQKLETLKQLKLLILSKSLK